MASTFLQKLKDRSLAHRSETHPTTIADNFFSAWEIEDIKVKIISLSEHWESFGDPTNSIPVRMLPAGMYSRSHDEYIKTIGKRSILEKYFEPYYVKIKDKIQSHFGIECQYPASVHYPGFHVFKALNSAGSYSYYNFHRDLFPHLGKLIPVGKIYSMIVPITLPTVGGNLIYSHNADSRKSIDDKSTYIVFPYKVGSMAMWEGSLLHSIEPFTLSADESRITLQFHISVLKDKISIFW
jgi:hypothetical protein